MIHEINIILMMIAFLLLLPLFKRKEGFNEFNFNDQGYIPYVSQDVMCMILIGSGVDVYKYGILPDKCSKSNKKPLNEDNSNICRI